MHNVYFRALPNQGTASPRPNEEADTVIDTPPTASRKGAPNARRPSWRRLASTSLLVALLAASFGAAFTPQSATSPRAPIGEFALVVPTVEFGLVVEQFAAVTCSPLGEDASLQGVLKSLTGDAGFAKRAARLAARRSDIQLHPQGFCVAFRDETGQTNYVGVEINAYEYMLFDVATGGVFVGDRAGVSSQYTISTIYYEGELDSTLAYTTFAPELQDRVRAALSKELPLSPKFQAGLLKLVYTEKRVDSTDQLIGYGPIEAIRYRVEGEEFTSIRFADELLDVDGFFHDDGSSIGRRWLENPVPGSWVSSPYNLRRKHPVLGVVKPHYGTDYAAPYGTPVLAASDGVVIARASTPGNGHYIKLRHDDRYQTQYLHLKGFARGIKPGSRVRKGQVIGYVGSTGLAKGPHLCFRFWRDGEQVDHRRLHLREGYELGEELMTAFEAKRDQLRAVLQNKA